MANETIKVVESLVQALLANDSGYFLVEVRVKPTNNLKVFIDGDQGISIEKCVRYNRALYKKLEEAALFPNGDFSLEVSSPGLDEPLKLLRQYRKNIGRQVEILRADLSDSADRRLVENRLRFPDYLVAGWKWCLRFNVEGFHETRSTGGASAGQTGMWAN